MIYLTQLLCRARHCLLACCWDDANSSAEEAQQKLQDLAKSMAMNPWCALCGNRELRIEHARTKYQTMQEAAPFIGQSLADQIETRKILEETGATFDAQLKRKNN